MIIGDRVTQEVEEEGGLESPKVSDSKWWGRTIVETRLVGGTRVLSLARPIQITSVGQVSETTCIKQSLRLRAISSSSERPVRPVVNRALTGQRSELE